MSTVTASPCSTEIVTVSEMLYPLLDIAQAVIAQFPTVDASQTPAFPVIIEVMFVFSPESVFSRVYETIDESIMFPSPSVN